MLICLTFSSCHRVSSQDGQPKTADERFSPDYEKPQVNGRIESAEITESSGLAASKCAADVFWTHNDSGNENELFALDGKGASLGKWKVTGAKNVDWEDISAFKNERGECFLYVGDIGNNSRKRRELTIYVVREPEISDRSGKTETAAALKFEYPDAAQDAETLMVHPSSGDIYVLTKRLSGPSAVYKLKSDYDLKKINRLEKVTDFTVPAVPNGFLTGGAIAPDGRRLVVCDYLNAYELKLPATAGNFDEIWKQKPQTIELGARELGEAVTYSADGNAIYATSEKRNAPFIEVRRK